MCIRINAAQLLVANNTLSDLPSKSKIKLGRWQGKELKWILARDESAKLILVAAPETGWFKFVMVGGGHGGGANYSYDASKPAYGSGAGGGSGGSGGICISKHRLSKGENILLTFQNGGCSVLSLDLKAYSGTNGTYGNASGATSASAGKGGIGGIASGGNISNISGKNGENGSTGYNRNDTDTFSAYGGASVSTICDGETSRSGGGGSVYKDSRQGGFSKTNPSSGTSAYMKIFRGNTNIPNPTNVSNLSITLQNERLTAS